MKYVYLDYAAGTLTTHPIPQPLPQGEGSNATDWLPSFGEGLGMGGNPSSIHAEGVQSKALLNRARNTISKILNCHDYEIYFMPNSTYSIATALTAGRDGTIITSNIEHPAVLENLNTNNETNQYDHNKNIILKVEENGILKAQTLRNILNSNPTPSASGTFPREGLDSKFIAFNAPFGELPNGLRGLVSIMYANNEIGTIQSSKEYGRIIEKYNRENNLNTDNRVLYHIDASQASNYLDLDIRKLRCDMMTINSSKCYGPRSVALLYIKEDIRHRVHPLMRGGNQERGMYSGTENVTGAMGFAEALTYVQSIKEEEGLRLCALRDTFIKMYHDEMWERRNCKRSTTPSVSRGSSPKGALNAKEETMLASISETILENKKCSSCVCGERLLYGSNEINERLPNNINIRVPGVPSDEMVIRLDQKGFAVSHRSACATAGRTSPEEGRRRAANDSNVTNDEGYVLKAVGASNEEFNENIRISMGLYTTMDDMMDLLTAILEIYDKYSKDL